jgi:hypothetical protein
MAQKRISRRSDTNTIGMKYRNKAHLARIAEVIGFLGTLYGIQRLAGAGFAGSDTWIALTILIASVALGLYGYIASRYYASRAENDNESQRLALETLSKLGKQMNKSKKQ